MKFPSSEGEETRPLKLRRRSMRQRKKKKEKRTQNTREFEKGAGLYLRGGSELVPTTFFQSLF